MRILIDINHPAHVHFFRRPIGILERRGHRVLITSREKEMATELLDRLGLEHKKLSRARTGLLGLARELIKRNRALYRVVREIRPDVMGSVGGTFVAQVGRMTRVPSVVFYDTENARVQNLLTYPFADQVVVPRCYEGRLPAHHRRYAGYHELSYLHPDSFTPQRAVALANGLAADGETFLLRVVGWQANHDVGERGWSLDLLRKLVEKLNQRGRVLLSSERPLPSDLAEFQYAGDPLSIHHVMAFCRLYVGESATMASECAVLGIPAIYAAHTGRGYTNEQERKYQLVRNLFRFDWRRLDEAIEGVLAQPREVWAKKRQSLLDDTIAVAPFVADCLEQFMSRSSAQCG